MTIKIMKPIMNAGNIKKGRREIGIALNKVWQEGEIVHVDITYRRKDGSRLYPNTFAVQKNKVLKCPTKTIKGVTLAIVPIDILKPIPQNQDQVVIVKTEPRNLGDVPTKPCWNCKGTKFWQAKWGEWFCCFCRSNPNPTINTIVVDIQEKKFEAATKS